LSESSPRIVDTPLRQAYERVRLLDPEEQIRACIEVLENPQGIAVDVAESFRIVEAAFKDGDLRPDELEAASEERDLYGMEPPGSMRAAI
jgi:hypothetical protein